VVVWAFVSGVFTDNRVLVDETGKESVFCDRADGMALSWLREAGIPTLILSKERNPVVEARAPRPRR
jgi:3-deoxy-D-manno-octulosonate 8-phosphate phosphatase KdsC-like HAD superfamily phosphatase